MGETSILICVEAFTWDTANKLYKNITKGNIKQFQVVLTGVSSEFFKKYNVTITSSVVFYNSYLLDPGLYKDITGVTHG